MWGQGLGQTHLSSSPPPGSNKQTTASSFYSQLCLALHEHGAIIFPHPRRAHKARRRSQSQRDRRTSYPPIQMDANNRRPRHHCSRRGEPQGPRPRCHSGQDEAQSRRQRQRSCHRRESKPSRSSFRASLLTSTAGRSPTPHPR